MLVVSRRPQEKINFPTLGITIQILRVTGSTAKLGIDAPPEVKILRDEVCPGLESTAKAKKEKHDLANVLSKVTLAIHLARKQWEAGRQLDANVTLEQALHSLDNLEQTQSTHSTPLRCRALIVDDDANERELLAGLLGMNGCDCATAADGVAAMDYLESGDRPDVVLLDMSMPRCNGPETLRRIRADHRLNGVHVFSVSSTSPEDLQIPDGPKGFDAWFPKPLNPRRLWDAMQVAVQSRQVTY